MHKQNCFITLTYRDDKLPHGNTLQHEDFQRFMKRLRKHVANTTTEGLITHNDKPVVDNYPPNGRIIQNQKPCENSKAKRKIRFYMAGEYGEKTERAHYHAILFGHDFADKKYYAKSRSSINASIYTSETLDKIWKNGNCYIGAVTFESAAYVARYIMKKINGEKQKPKYEKIIMETGEIIDRKPEYNKMSLKPGIGAKWLEKYAADAYPEGKVVARNHKSKTPKYYDKKYKKLDPIGYEDMLFEREKEQQKRPGENSEQRLAAQETVAKAKIAFLKRNTH